MPQPGDDVRVVMRKWVDAPHWEHDAVFLGSDGHGDWVGLRTGTSMSRPGLTLDAQNDMVCLAPGGERWWVATFHRDSPHLHTYVDMSTPLTWVDDGGTPVLTAVDLDLDVVRTADGHVWIDDEDEFAEHQVALGYPDEVIAAAERTATAVLDAVLAERAPYDGTAQRWFAELDRWS
jgi:hypothetical protein